MNSVLPLSQYIHTKIQNFGRKYCCLNFQEECPLIRNIPKKFRLRIFFFLNTHYRGQTSSMWYASKHLIWLYISLSLTMSLIHLKMSLIHLNMLYILYSLKIVIIFLLSIEWVNAHEYSRWMTSLIPKRMTNVSVWSVGNCYRRMIGGWGVWLTVTVVSNEWQP